jgi:D-inositol-3-phosphate glycosyltransferase
MSKDFNQLRQDPGFEAPEAIAEAAVTLLTGGIDRPYVFGLTTALRSKGVSLDMIGSDELDCQEYRQNPGINFLNLQGSRAEASFVFKVFRVLKYYATLIRYAATARPRIFHILWNNKFEYFDRTFLMLYYKLLGKRVVLTAHNVNAAKRDSKDTVVNRLTLGMQYRLADHIFIHTERMKEELVGEFGIAAAKITVIPFGINNFAPNTSLTTAAAKQRLGISEGRRTILFFGRITPYKGLEYLIAALRLLLEGGGDYRLIIAGRLKDCEEYWKAIRETFHQDEQSGRILVRAEYIPEEETEIYFKAADVLVLPYRDIYQSGVLFLGHSFGLPVIAADVGSLKDDIVQGKTGFVFKPQDPEDLANSIERYFASDLYADLGNRRRQIRDYSAARHSWTTVADITMSVYDGLLGSLPASGSVATRPVSQ